MNIFTFLNNARKDVMSIARSHNAIKINFPTLCSFDIKEILTSDNMIFKQMDIPEEIPGIMITHMEASNSIGTFPKIVVNKAFYTQPTWVQESFIAHEMGHYHRTFKHIENKTPEYWEEELQCDLYAIEQGHDQLEALMWLMYNHPAVYDSTRLKNLAKATGKTLPLLFRVIK